MTTGRRVLLMLGCSRASERGLLRGIVRYSRFHDPWIFYREPPFYRRPPYHSLPRPTQTGKVTCRFVLERHDPQSGDGGPNRASPFPADGFDTRDVDGLVGFAANQAQMEVVLPASFPCVILPIEERIPGRCCIVEEAYTVGRMAAEHFLDRGFTRFAFCGFDQMYWSRVRQEGFTRRLAEAGFAVHLYEPGSRNEEMVGQRNAEGMKDRRRAPQAAPCNSTLPAFPRSAPPAAPVPWEAEQAFVAEWLRSLPKPIGLMVCNDDRAQQVLEANKAAGARIPEEIAVLGVDNDEMICELTHPPLSSIALNFEEAGYEAAAQLDQQMRGKKPSLGEVHLRPTHVHTRQSTDVLAVEDPIVARALRFIRTRAGEVLSVDDVVDATSTSRRLLERHFRQTVGLTIYGEIQRAHVERACRMLAETNWPLEEVARRCGFSNCVHFSVAFKRQMKRTPEQHRRRAARPRWEDGERRVDVAKSKDKDAKSNSLDSRSGRE
jgi:LacI family transcriptional regulator